MLSHLLVLDLGVSDSSGSAPWRGFYLTASLSGIVSVEYMTTIQECSRFVVDLLTCL